MPKRKQLDSLHTLLLRRCASHSDDARDPISAGELFQEFELSGLDYRGQVSTAYGDSGTSATITAAFNFGDLIAPGFVELELRADGRITSLDRALLFLEHVGGKIGELSACYDPIRLCVMTGGCRSLTVTLSASAGIGMPELVDTANGVLTMADPEGLAASLEAFAGAEARATYRLDHIYVTDPAPGRYFKAGQPELAERFATVLEASARGSIKSGAAELLERYSLKVKRRGVPPFRTWKTDDLLQNLEKAGGRPDLTQSDRVLLEYYQRTLKALKSPPPQPPARPHQTHDGLAFLSLWGQSGDASAGLKAEVHVMAQVPNHGGQVDAEAGAGITGSLKRTGYRLQTWYNGPDQNPIVITRDTVISYRQLQLKAEAQATLKRAGLQAGPRGAEWSKAAAYNMMSYSSSVAFWPYATDSTVTPIMGTGVSYGVSVLIARLVLAIRELTAGQVQRDTGTLLEMLARRLRVRRPLLEGFLMGSIFADVGIESFPTHVVLLESSFETPLDPLATVTDPATHRKVLHKDIATQLHTRAAASTRAEPLALRIRYRIADVLHNERTLFKLGPSLLRVTGIQIHSVQEAGVEGIIDLETRFYDRLKGKEGREAYDLAVPAVALIHQ